MEFASDGAKPTEEDRGRTDIIPNKEDRAITPVAELLKYHYNFGHTSFTKLKETANQDIIPKTFKSFQRLSV